MSEHRQKNPTQNVVDFGKTHKDYERNNSHMFQEVRKYQVYEEGQEIFLKATRKLKNLKIKVSLRIQDGAKEIKHLKDN